MRTSTVTPVGCSAAMIDHRVVVPVNDTLMDIVIMGHQGVGDDSGSTSGSCYPQTVNSLKLRVH